MKPNKKDYVSILVYSVILWSVILLLAWIIQIINSYRIKDNYYTEYQNNIGYLASNIDLEYDHFMEDSNTLNSNWTVLNEPLIEPDTSSLIVITNKSSITTLNPGESDYKLLVFKNSNNTRIAYINLELFLSQNNIQNVVNHFLLVDIGDGTLYFDNKNILINENFYYYFTERDGVSFNNYLAKFDSNSLAIKFSQKNYLISFTKTNHGLMLIDLARLEKLDITNNTILLSLIIFLAVPLTIVIILKKLKFNKRFSQSEINRMSLSDSIKYNDNNIILWITVRGRIIDYNEKAKFELKGISQGISIYQLFNETDNTFEVYIKNQIEFNVNLGDNSFDFKSLTQQHGYLLIGRSALESSIEESKYRKAVFMNQVTNLPNELTLFEQFNYLNIDKKPSMAAFGVLDFEHITLVLGKNYVKELLNEISNYLYEKTKGLPIQLFNPEKDLFVVLFESSIDFDHMGWVRRVIMDANSVVHKKTNTRIQLNAAVLEVDHRNVKDGAESLYYILLETLNRVKESPIYDVLLYHDSLGINLRQDAVIEKDIKNAIIKDEFVIFLQPIFNLDTNKIVSFEALLRWNNPTYSKMSPQKYLKIIETNYLMKDLSNIILTKVVQTAKKLTPYNLSITVNVSANEIIHDGFIAKIVNLCKEYDVDPKQIGIEITENVLIHSEELIRQKVKTLRKYGFKIYIDDFGTGYSSLNYLRYLEVDIIKIDRIFINDITQNEKSLEIYKTIVKLVKRLGLNVVSEGVETQEQKDLLKQMGVELIQGFLVSLAIPVDEAILKLENKKGS